MIDIQLKDPGIYLIHWESGGSSLASIGILPNGKRWMAPTNWTNLTEEDFSKEIKWMDHIVIADNIKRKENKMESKKDFREGDKVVVYKECKVKEGIILSIGKNAKVEYNNGNYEYIHLANITHDHERQILKTIEAAIYDHETKPKRMVKRWVNIFMSENGERFWAEHLTPADAEKAVKDSGYNDYIHIAYEMELPEKF